MNNKLNMVKKRLNRNTKIMIIVLCALLLTSIYGLSAYLTSYDENWASFGEGSYMLHLRADIRGFENFQEPIIPNEEIEFCPTAVNDGRRDAYAFMEVDIPVSEGGVELYNYEMGLSPWIELGAPELLDMDGAIFMRHIFGYGEYEDPLVLGRGMESEPVFPAIRMTDLNNEQYMFEISKSIIVKAYGLQSTNVNQTDPFINGIDESSKLTMEEAWQLIQGV